MRIQEKTPSRLLPIAAKYESQAQVVDGQTEPRKVDSLYHLNESDSFSIEVISHSPPDSDERRVVGQRILQIQCDQEGTVSVQGNSSLDLRQYTSETVRFKARHIEELQEARGAIEFRVDDRDGWPAGPNLVLRFGIAKKSTNVFLTVVSGVIGFALSLLVPKIWDTNPVYGIVAGVMAAALVVLTILLGTGRIGFKL